MAELTDAGGSGAAWRGALCKKRSRTKSAALPALMTIGAVLVSGCIHLGGRSADSCCDATCNVPAASTGAYSPGYSTQSGVHAPLTPAAPQYLPPVDPLSPPQEPPREPAPKAPAPEKFLPPAQKPEPALPPGTEKPVPMPAAPMPVPTTRLLQDSGFRPASASYFPPGG